MKKYKKIITTLLLCGAIAFTFSACGGGGGGGGGGGDEDSGGSVTSPTNKINSFMPQGATLCELVFLVNGTRTDFLLSPSRSAICYIANQRQGTGQWSGVPSSFSIKISSPYDEYLIQLVNATITNINILDSTDGKPSEVSGNLTGDLIIIGQPTPIKITGTTCKLYFDYE